MIDTYILYLQNQLYIQYYPEKMLNVDLVCLIVIKKTKTEIKAMWHGMLPMLS